MPSLLISDPSGEHRRVGLSSYIAIGRDSANSVVLNTPHASRFHAGILQDADGSYHLVDFGSRNATRINGKKVVDRVLTPGAVFEIDTYRFQFLEDMDEKDGHKLLTTSQLTLGENSHLLDCGTKLVSGVSEVPDSSFLTDPEKKLNLLMNLTLEIASIVDYRQVLDQTLKTILRIMSAERGFIALKDLTGELLIRSRDGFENETDNLRVSLTMVHKVMQEGYAIRTENALHDENFLHAKSVIAYQIKSVMCVPLIIKNEVIGLIYIANCLKESGFSNHDLNFVSILASQIAIAIENARLHRKLREEHSALQEQLQLQENTIALSAKMQTLYSNIKKVAPTNLSVLILGESGTGKELVAQAVHKESGRSGPFKALNCSAIPENLLESELFGHEKGVFTGADTVRVGFFEAANGGTLFLDEIGDMSLSLQPKLLRVLQEKKVTRLGSRNAIDMDVRIVAATNKDIKKLIKQEKFREDLYYRLKGVELTTHPLRERKEDILPLAYFFLAKFSAENKRRIPKFSPKVLPALVDYPWPGNINELKHAVQCAAALCTGNTITLDDLPSEILQTLKAYELENLSLEHAEKKHIMRILRLTQGNMVEAARRLKISRSQLYVKIKEYKIASEPSTSP